MAPIYVECRYCDKCMIDHFVEVWRDSAGAFRQRCRGADLALETEKTFAKRSGKGYKIYKVRGIKKELKMPKPTTILQDQDHIKNLQVDF